MPATSGIDGSTASANYTVTAAYALIEGHYPGPKSYCSKVTRQFGKEPGEAEVIIPLRDLNTVVPGVAGVITHR